MWDIFLVHIYRDLVDYDVLLYIKHSKKLLVTNTVMYDLLKYKYCLRKTWIYNVAHEWVREDRSNLHNLLDNIVN